MENIDNWLETKKKEWKKSIEETKELGNIDADILDIMSALVGGIKVIKRSKNK